MVMSVRSVQNSSFAPLLTGDQNAKRLHNQRLFSGSVSSGPPIANDKVAVYNSNVNASASQTTGVVKSAHFDENCCVKSKVYSINWTCDGERLAVATRENVLITNPYSLTTECTIATAAMGVLPHPHHPDLVAVLSYDKPIVKIYDFRVPLDYAVVACTVSKTANNISSAATKYKDKGPGDSIDIRTSTVSLISGAWSPDGRLIVVSDRMDVIQAIDISSPVLSAKSTENQTSGCVYHDVPVNGKLGTRSVQQETEVGMVCFDCFGDLLFVTKQDGMIDVYPANPLSLNQDDKVSLQVHHSYVYNAACDPTGTLIATGGLDQTISLVDIESLSAVSSIPRIDGTVSSLSFSYTGELLAWGTKDSAAGYSSTVRTGSSSNQGSGAGEALNSGGDWLVSIGGVNPCEVYRTFSQSSPVASVSWHPFRNILAYACETGGGGTNTSGSSNEYFMTTGYDSWNSGGFWSNKPPKLQHSIGIITVEE